MRSYYDLMYRVFRARNAMTLCTQLYILRAWDRFRCAFVYLCRATLPWLGRALLLPMIWRGSRGDSGRKVFHCESQLCGRRGGVLYGGKLIGGYVGRKTGWGSIQTTTVTVFRT